MRNDQFVLVEEGVMAMKNGLAWGVVYADGLVPDKKAAEARKAATRMIDVYQRGGC